MSEKSIISIEAQGGVAIGRIACHTIGEREAPIIRDEALEAAKGLSYRLALDFTHVTMMGSMALGTLVSMSKDCKGGGGGMSLFGLNDNLSDILKMSRLDKLLPIAKDEKQAIKKAK